MEDPSQWVRSMLRPRHAHRLLLASALACACAAPALASEPVEAEPVPVPGLDAAINAPAESAASARQRAQRLDRIEVRAPDIDRAGNRLQDDIPGMVSMLGASELNRRATRHLADALRYAPGVLATSDAGNDGGVLSIRGSNLTAINYANGGVLLLQDGLPVSSADGANHNRLPDALAGHGLVIANGANALAYGASNLGGAIDFISATARNEVPRLALATGSHGLASLRASQAGIGAHHDAWIGLETRRYDGYREHSQGRREGAYGNLGWQPSGDLELRLHGSWIDNREQLPGALSRAQWRADPRQADRSYAWGDHQLNVRTARFALTGHWRIDPASALDFGISHEQQALYHPIVDVLDFRSDPPISFFSLLIDTRQRTRGAMLRYQHEAGAHRWLLGSQFARTDNHGDQFENERGQRGAPSSQLSQRANDAKLYLLDHWTLADAWRLVYGAQYVNTDRELRSTALPSAEQRLQRRRYRSINPRIGLIRNLGARSEIFANLSRIHQAPTLFELDNEMHGDATTLDPTRGGVLEIGTRGQRRDSGGDKLVRWSLALYHARLRDEVLAVENPARPGTMLSANYARSLHSGVEALLAAQLGRTGSAHRFEPTLSLNWNHFRLDRDPLYDDHRLPYAPAVVLRAELLYRHDPGGFFAGPTLDHLGTRQVDMANSYRVGSQTVVGLRAGIERERWNLFLELGNLTDRAWIEGVSVRTVADADAAVLKPGAPRSLYLGWHYAY